MKCFGIGMNFLEYCMKGLAPAGARLLEQIHSDLYDFVIYGVKALKGPYCLIIQW